MINHDPNEVARPGDLPREPYEAPAVIAEEVFETLAMTCTKLAGGGAGCSPPFGTPSVS